MFYIYVPSIPKEILRVGWLAWCGGSRRILCMFPLFLSFSIFLSVFYIYFSYHSSISFRRTRSARVHARLRSRGPRSLLPLPARRFAVAPARSRSRKNARKTARMRRDWIQRGDSRVSRKCNRERTAIDRWDGETSLRLMTASRLKHFTGRLVRALLGSSVAFWTYERSLPDPPTWFERN